MQNNFKFNKNYEKEEQEILMINSKNEKSENNLKKKIIRKDLKKEENTQNNQLIKKYHKIMIKTFITNIHFDEKLKEKLFEQYQKNQEVRNIILEMAIKLKDWQHFLN